MSKSRNASEAFANHQREITRLGAELAAKLQEIGQQDPSRKDWGHVGDLAALESDLKSITDRLYLRGEYAA